MNFQLPYDIMDELKKRVEAIISLMGFKDYSVSVEPTTQKISVVINDESLKDQLSNMVGSLGSLARVIAKKYNIGPIVFDINNYHRERENIIIDLAKAAARRVVATKEPVTLPAMNAYERRLVHTEIGMRPDVKTESVGEGKDRCIVVKIVE